MCQKIITDRNKQYILHSQQPKLGELFYHRQLKRVDRVTDIHSNDISLTGIDLEVCRMIFCSLVTEYSVESPVPHEQVGRSDEVALFTRTVTKKRL